MKMNAKSLALAVALALPAAGPAIAGGPVTPEAPMAQSVAATAGYLGVSLVPVPEVLRAQLAAVLPAGQGVMIGDSVQGSPAAQAGLQAYDVLVRFDDQQLFSAAQVVGLVRAAGPGKVVVLQLVRGAASKQVQVSLGSARAQVEAVEPAARQPWMGWHPHWPHPDMAPRASSSGGWESFDSLTLEKLDKGGFRAEIQYLGADGGLVKQEFTGTRDEIRQQILKQESLPATERDQLLDALAARDVPAWPSADFGPRFPPHWFHWGPDAAKP